MQSTRIVILAVMGASALQVPLPVLPPSDVGFRDKLEHAQFPAVPDRGRVIPRSAQATPRQVKASAQTLQLFERLMAASEIRESDGRVILTAADVDTALNDMHLRRSLHVPGIEHPLSFLPEHLYSNDPVDATSLVKQLPLVLETHSIFSFMVQETLGNDDFYTSVYFGTSTRDELSLSFASLCRRLVTSMYVFEVLLELPYESRYKLAEWYEALLESSSSANAREATSKPRSPRDALLGFFLALKGESVLAAINTFEMIRRVADRGDDGGAEKQTHLRQLSRVLNALMSVNIFEAVISNLSFAFWPDNARAGMALLLSQHGEYGADLRHDVDSEWFDVYLAWNANFIWPSHYFSDMMCFTMLATPSIALRPPEEFCFNRAHSLFWVVRSAQLTRLQQRREPSPSSASRGEVPCFRCRQLEPSNDRQPLTSRTAELTRRAGERLAEAAREDVSDGSGVWRRLVFEVAPLQLSNLVRLYRLMPKTSPTKLRLL
mmetsp:Transcript_33700/g.88606  ORF Transcript_33700/g.88606 Transcript_33700/m.88606 type:complete len:492 (+) Transcript_33700:24-1499(+)